MYVKKFLKKGTPLPEAACCYSAAESAQRDVDFILKNYNLENPTPARTYPYKRGEVFRDNDVVYFSWVDKDETNEWGKVSL